MPHHATALHAGCASAQPLQYLGRCAVLLVTAHHLDARPAVGVHTNGAGAQYVQQVVAGEHARYQALLGVHVLHGAVVLRVERFPVVKMLFARSNGAVVCLQPAAANQQQIAMEEARLAFTQARGGCLCALVHIALQLHKSLSHGVGAGFRALFALHHAQRNAVHQQHYVRNDEGLHTARRVYAELVDGVKRVVLRVRKVNQLHHWVRLARSFVYIHLRFE